MKRFDVARWRLSSQHITDPAAKKPSDVVSWMGAVQAQDYAAAKWAVGLRTKEITDAAIEQAFADGAILRTHVLRPTWHFVTPADIRWMLALTAPRIKAASVYQYRNLGLDDDVFARSNAALARALQGGKHYTRAELKSVLEQAGIVTNNLRFIYLIMRAELDGILCSGARRGKQFTYALLDERAPATKTLEHDQALTEVTQRYFASHGPATEEDFIWWSGMTRADVRKGLEEVKQQLAHEMIEGRTYWFSTSKPPSENSAQVAFLLPNYDEYVVGYTDRGAIFDSSHAKHLDARGNPLFQHTIVLKGQIVGTWKRTLKRDTIVIETNLFTRLTKAQEQAVAKATQGYGAFLELPVVLAKG